MNAKKEMTGRNPVYMVLAERREEHNTYLSEHANLLLLCCMENTQAIETATSVDTVPAIETPPSVDSVFSLQDSSLIGRCTSCRDIFNIYGIPLSKVTYS